MRDLEVQEGCGERVGGINFVTSEVEPFQKNDQVQGAATKVGEGSGLEGTPLEMRRMRG